MGVIELLITAVALSMDAFAVAIGKGLCVPQVRLRHSVITGSWFGGFQALMPLLGYALASTFAVYISSADHWIAFGLMALIGGNMLREVLSKEEEQEECNTSFGCKVMLPLAVATSIDAMASGVAFAMTDANIWIAVVLIGVITFAFSAVGVKIGNLFGTKYKKKAELAGGLILILMGLKILIEHLSGNA